MSDGVDYNIAEAPLYFVRSGYIDIANGKRFDTGDKGQMWSSRTDITASGYAIYLNIGSTKITPSNSFVRSNAFPLRCLAS